MEVLLEPARSRSLIALNDWRSLEDAASDLLDIVKTLDSETSTGELREAMLWAEALRSNIRGQRREQLELVPWLQALERDEPSGPDTDSAASSATSLLADMESVGVEQFTGGSRGTRRSVAKLSRRARQLVDEMDFRFLYDETRDLFSIGYLVEDAARRRLL